MQERTILCKACNTPFQSAAPNARFCKDCGPKILKDRFKGANRNQSKNKGDISRQAAVSILEQTLAPHIAETVADLLLVACHQNKIAFNEFVVRNGFRAATKTGSLELSDPDVAVVGEASSTRNELYRIYDASLWREPEVTFEQFLQTRAFKSDGYQFGKELLKKDFEECHRNWFSFWPELDATTLKAGYTQSEMEQWLDAQSKVKDFLLLASRNSRKSSTAIVWLVAALVTCPDLSVLMVSCTKSLSRGFIRGLRSYFEVNWNNPSRFQTYFPEFCIRPEEGSALEFRNPMAHLNLIEGVESTSMDSSVAGRRAHLIVGDDIADNISMATPELRDSNAEKWALIGKLRTTSGLTLMQATPYHKDDIYGRLIKQNEDSSEPFLKLRTDPCWIIKEEARRKPLKDLIETDIESYLCDFLNWKFLSTEVRKNSEKTFRNQNMCQFTDSEEELLKLAFDLDVLRSAVIPLAALPRVIDTIMTIDVSFSANKYSDLSAISVLGVCVNPEGEKFLTCLWNEGARVKGSELGAIICRLTKAWNPRLVLCEKPAQADLFQAEIQRQSIRYDISIPLSFLPINSERNAKFTRLKSLETVIAAGKLKFLNSGWAQESLFEQMLNLSSTPVYRPSRKNDLADSLGMGVKFLASVIGQKVEPENSEESKKQVQEWLRQSAYNMIYGLDKKYTPPPPPEPERVDNSKRGILGEYGRRLLGPGYRV